MSGPDESPSGRPRWRHPRALTAWALVAAGVAVVLGFGAAAFDAPATSRFLVPILRWLYPDLTLLDLIRFAATVRKLAHPIEYSVLAILAFRAWRLSLAPGLVRVACLACVLALCVAAVDELQQAGNARRTGSVWDVVLDASGAVLAVALATQLVRRRIAPRLLGGT